MKIESLRIVALCLAAMLVISIISCSYEMFQKVSEQVRYEAELLALEKHVADLHQQDAINRRTSTLLHELEPGDSLEVLGGLFEFRPSRKLLSGQPVIRWYIPGKVTPQVYEEPGGRLYSWVDHQTKKVEGPFDPEVVK